MPFEVTPLLTVATNGLIGGVVDSTATDPLTVDAGVTLDGSIVATIPLPALTNLLSGVVGDGVKATASNAAVTNLGTIKGANTAGLGIDLLGGGTVTNAANATVSGFAAGIGIAGTAAGGTSTVVNNGIVSATGQNGAGVILDAGALTNGGTIAAANVGGIGVSIGTGTVVTSLGSSITGALDGLDATGSTIVTNAGAITGTAGDGVTLAAGQLTNAATGTVTGGVDGISLTGGNLTNAAGGTITGAVDGVLNTGAGTLDNAGTVLGTAGDGLSTAAGTLINRATGLIKGTVNGIAGTGTAAITNIGKVIGQAASGVTLAGGSLLNSATAAITGATDGVLGTAGSGPGQVTNLGTITATGNGGIGVNLLDGGVVVDSGTIGGTTAGGTPGGIAVNLGGAGGSRLVLDPGAVLNGVAQAAGVGNTLEIAAGNGTTALKDIGTTITGFATTLLDTGAVADVLGAVTTPGTLKVGDGASLTLGGPVLAGVTVDLGGAGAKLTLSDPSGFAGTIANLGPDDVLDLGALGTGATVAYDPTKGALAVSVGGVVSDLIPVQLAAGLDPLNLGLTLGSDGMGGTTVTVGTGTGGTGGNGGGGTGSGGTGGTGTGTTGGTGTGGNGGTGTGGTGGAGTGTTGGTGTGGSGGTGTGGTGNGGTGTTVTTDPGTGTTTTTVGGPSGSSAVTTGSPSSGTTVSTTSPQGATTSFVLPAGSSVTQGTGLAAGDVVSIDPHANFAGRGGFVVSGHVASTSGIKSVTISANVDYKSPTVLGTATVAADGSYTFLDKVGRHLQGFITATATDGLGASTSVQSSYSLQAGIRSPNHVAQEVRYSPEGDATAVTNYAAGGSSVVHVRDSGQTLQSEFRDTFDNHAAPNNTFVFNPGYGADTINLFRAVGTDHDTISLPSSDFANLADVIANTQNTKGGAVITDPTTGDTIKLTGISKAELKANPSDFTFHA